MKSGEYLRTSIERWLVPAVFTGYAIWYLFDADSYYISLREDGLPEWATFVFLMAAGILAGMAATRMRRRGDRRFWFLLMFSAGSLLAGLEEISWGQRVFGLESTGFFLDHSDSQEMNAHNVLQNVLAIKTKHVAGLVLLFYGVGLPLLGRIPVIAGFCRRWGVVVPPGRMILSWGLAALLMLDRPTGEEEELGELLFSLCFFLLAMGQWLETRTGAES